MELKTETTDLSGFVKSVPTRPDAKIGTEIYECERLPLAVMKYPKIDLSFFGYLAQHESGVWLPLFAWFEIGDKQIRPFVVAIETWTTLWRIECDQQRITEIVRTAIAKKMNLEITNNGDIREGLPIEKNRRRKYSATFHGIIPQATKVKIKEAEPLFDEIAIVAEEHNWAMEEIKTDPLVIGRIGGNAFLIDHFETTKAEDYVLAEFKE